MSQHHQHQSGYYPQHRASAQNPHQQHPHLPPRASTQYPPPPAAAPDPTRPNPAPLASSSGVILHQPYPNSVRRHPAQAQYAQHHTGHGPTAASSSAAAPPPPIPTHTRPIDMPPSPARPGSTHYGSDPFSLSQYSLQRSMTPGPYMLAGHPSLQPGSPSGAPSYPNYLDLPKSPPKENRCQYPNCDASFDRRYDLKRHILSRHQEPDFQCPFCQKKLSRSDALTRHYGTCSNRAAMLAARHPPPTQ